MYSKCWISSKLIEDIWWIKIVVRGPKLRHLKEKKDLSCLWRNRRHCPYSEACLWYECKRCGCPSPHPRANLKIYRLLLRYKVLVRQIWRNKLLKLTLHCFPWVRTKRVSCEAENQTSYLSQNQLSGFKNGEFTKQHFNMLCTEIFLVLISQNCFTMFTSALPVINHPQQLM